MKSNKSGCQPLLKCEFEPDVAVVYGNSAQILTLIHAANYRKGSGIASLSTGRGGCSSWIAGAIQSNECTYTIPGPGERVFGGTQDYEVSFAIPYQKFESVIDGLKYIPKKGGFQVSGSQSCSAVGTEISEGIL